MIFNKLSKHLISNQSQLIEVSIGEIADKYSILELKNKYITDTNKLNEIKKEIDILKIKVAKSNSGMRYVTDRTKETTGHYIKKYVNYFKEKKSTPWDGLLRINL